MLTCDWSSDVCSSDLITGTQADNVDVEIGYTAGEPTLIREKGGEVLLTDRLPQLEI